MTEDILKNENGLGDLLSVLSNPEDTAERLASLKEALEAANEAQVQADTRFAEADERAKQAHVTERELLTLEAEAGRRNTELTSKLTEITDLKRNVDNQTSDLNKRQGVYDRAAARFESRQAIITTALKEIESLNLE